MKFLTTLFGDLKKGTLTRLAFFGYNCLVLGFVIAIVLSIYMIVMGNMSESLENPFLLLSVIIPISLISGLFFAYIVFVLIVKRLRDMGAKHVYLFAALFSVLGFSGNLISLFPDFMPILVVGSIWYTFIILVIQFTPSGHLKK